MNFQFTVTAHGFEKADKIEKMLRELGIPFEATMIKGCSTKSPAKRAKIDKAKLAIVMTAIDKHPDRSDKEIGRESGVSEASANRIRNGQHPLQIDKRIGINKKVAK